MKFVDAAGNQLEEGMPVAFPLAFGVSQPGKIVKLGTGIGVGPASIPHVAVAVMFMLDVQPNGLVGGILAMPTPKGPFVE
jgi:ABC-type sulfate transport system permease component